MTQHPTGVPSHLQPRPKAPATSNTFSLDATASVTPPPLSREPSHVQRLESSKAHVDTTSNNATATLIRRTLCQSQGLVGTDKDRTAGRPVNELLPPLTSSNDVDLQLYAFIAIIIKEFVYSWYSKITPDQDFVDEVIQIIAHCTRALEQRLRHVDIETLVLDEIPELLEAHIVSYRIAHRSMHPDSLAPEPLQLYHALHPHPALSPAPSTWDHSASASEQQGNETVYRQMLVQSALAVLLPTEDLGNACLRTLVAEVFGELVLGNGIGGKGSQGWLLWEGITKIVDYIKKRTRIAESPVRIHHTTKSRLEQFGLVSPDPSIEGIRDSSHTSIDFWSAACKIIWLVVYVGFSVFITVRFMVVALVTSSSLPTRSSSLYPPSHKSSYSDGRQPPSDTSTKAAPVQRQPPSPKQPILSMRSWSCISHLLELDSRMPWLSGLLSFCQWIAVVGPGKVGDTNGMLDKFLSHLLAAHVLTPTHLPPLLLNLRTTLFPNNSLAPPRIPPTASEIAAIKSRCANSILSLLPQRALATYFATKDVEQQRKEVEEVLGLFDDTYCNKHLLYGLVELIFLRVMPELGEMGVKELMEARLN